MTRRLAPVSALQVTSSNSATANAALPSLWSPGGGCVGYRYDTATGIVTIGGVIGRVTPKAVYVNGIGRSDDSEGELFNERTFTQRIGYPSPGKRYGASWRFKFAQFQDVGPATVKLTLRKNGTFTLAYAFGGDEELTTRKAPTP